MDKLIAIVSKMKIFYKLSCVSQPKVLTTKSWEWIMDET
jgi:hypothetical protein